MSARWQEQDEPVRLRAMSLHDLDAVLAIEALAYGFPWTRGNFIDSLAAGYLAEVLLDDAGVMQGYFVAMAGVDELHLLNITVAPPYQGQGLGGLMLQALDQRMQDRGWLTLWLEVRESNQRAHALYLRSGFAAVGRRRAYYPAPQGAREDAIVMKRHVGRSHGLV